MRTGASRMCGFSPMPGMLPRPRVLCGKSSMTADCDLQQCWVRRHICTQPAGADADLIDSTLNVARCDRALQGHAGRAT